MTDAYFSLLERIERARAQKRYYQALELSLEAVKWLPQLVKDTTKEFGRWDIISLPPLAYANKYLSVLRRRDDLRRIRTLLESVPELTEWLSEVDHALERADLMDRVESFLLENPGFIQSNLSKALGVDGREISNLLWYAEQMGIVCREKEGRSYRLYSEKEGAMKDDVCSKCGRPLLKDAKFCVTCHTPTNHKDVEKTTMVCSECGREMQSESKFCPSCGARVGEEALGIQDQTNTPKTKTTRKSFKEILAENRAKHTHKSFKEDVKSVADDKVIMEARGFDGELLLLEDRIRITHPGFLGLAHLADREIPLSEITAIGFKKPGFMGAGGRISFSFAGTETSLGLSGVNTRNTVIFDSKQEEAFVAIKNAIDERRAALRATPRASSPLDELEKLASLRDKGIITEDEFQQKKKQILGL